VNTLKIELSAKHNLRPCDLQIFYSGESIHDGKLETDLVIEHQTDGSRPFDLTIIKRGKTKKLTDQNGVQEVVVESVNLNGIDLKHKEFGIFSAKDNHYIDDQTLQTNRLHLNGEWNLRLPRYNLVGDISTVVNKERRKIRDEYSDTDIACFGCSQTYGEFVEYDETWPSQLGRYTGKLVKNYGVSGSNINEMTAMVEDFMKAQKAEIILLYVPHTFRRQIRKGNEIVNQLGDEFWSQNKEIVLNGEEHSIAVLAGAFEDWLENISKHTKIYFGTYQRSENAIYQKTPLKKFMFPFLEGNDYPKASDKVHHGPEFNRDFAKILGDFLIS